MEKLSGEQVRQLYKEARLRAVKGLAADVPGVLRGRASLYGWIDNYLKGLRFPKEHFGKGSWDISNKMIESLRLGRASGGPHFHKSLLKKKNLLDILFTPQAQKLNPFAQRELRTRVGDLARSQKWVPRGFS